MTEFLVISPEVLKGVFTGGIGALITGSTVYLVERSKRRALLNDNKKLVEETENIKADYNRKLEEVKRDHELDISKRKFQYESKKASYVGFFQKLDQLNAELNIKSVSKMQEMTQKFTESCLYAKSDEEYNEGILQYQIATQSILMESQRDINKLKHETSEIKLHASSQITEGLNKLEKAYELVIQESNVLIQKMPTIILSGDSSLMTLNQQNLIQQAAEVEVIKQKLIENMRYELDEI